MDFPRRSIQLRSKSDIPRAANFWMLQCHIHVPSLNLLILPNLSHVVNRPSRHSCILQNITPLGCRPRSESLLQSLLQSLPIQQTPSIVRILFDFEQIPAADRATHPFPVRLIRSSNRNVTVGSPECLIRRRKPMRRSQRRRYLTSSEIARRLPNRVGQRRLHNAHFEILPLARLQPVDIRRQNPVRRVQTRIQIRHRDTHLDRRRTGYPRETHHSTHALRNQVETCPLRIRPSSSET